MGILAVGNITLSPVNDGCSIMLTRGSCTVRTAFDGSSPDLSQAYTDISLMRGDAKVPISGANISVSVPDGVEYAVTTVDASTQRISITKLPVSLSLCEVNITLSYSGFSSSALFSITTVRETSMLDWILDWEENKTKIGSTYILTPKIYAGTVTEGENGGVSVSGVYIGPDSQMGAGVYGYKDGKEIFHLNSTGGGIAGWDITTAGISTSDGTLQLLSEGTIKSSLEDGSVAWGLYKNGTASFANGKVQFGNDGSATYEGRVISSSGQIGDWLIKAGYLYNNHILLHSEMSIIGISNAEITEDNSSSFLDLIRAHGGIAMHYDSTSYGLTATLPVDSSHAVVREIFTLGSINKIAGWNFDDEALYCGTKSNILGSTTSSNGDITIGTFGIRGYKWRIESNGECSFADGKFLYENGVAKIAGWKLSDDALYDSHIVMSSGSERVGVYLSDAEIAGHSGSEIESIIKAASGIYLRHDSDKGAELYIGCDGTELFRVNVSNTDGKSSGYICGWKFSPDGLYCGATSDSAAGSFTSGEGDIFIGKSGLRGHAWRIEPDGSGSVAKGNLRWDNEGRLFIGPEAEPGTTITDAAILTETIMVQNSASYIGAGISADGSEDGSIRFWAGASYENKTSAPFRVQQDGSVAMTKAKVSGEINAYSGSIGGFEINSGCIGAYGKGDSTSGLSIYETAIYIRNNSSSANEASVFVGIGDALPSTAGTKCAGRFEVRNNSSSGDGGVALLVKYQNPRNERYYKPLALKRIGNEFAIGKTSRFETGYIGEAYSDTLENWFPISHTFVFSSISMENLALYLPSSALVESALEGEGVGAVTFSIRIIVATSISNKITLMPPRQSTSDNTATGEIFRADSSVGSIALDEKDTIELQYYLGNWYVVSQNWNYK